MNHLKLHLALRATVRLTIAFVHLRGQLSRILFRGKDLLIEEGCRLLYRG